MEALVDASGTHLVHRISLLGKVQRDPKWPSPGHECLQEKHKKREDETKWETNHDLGIGLEVHTLHWENQSILCTHVREGCFSLGVLSSAK